MFVDSIDLFIFLGRLEYKRKLMSFKDLIFEILLLFYHILALLKAFTRSWGENDQNQTLKLEDQLNKS